MGELDPVFVKPPGVEIARYWVIGDPPFVTEGVKATEQVVFPADAEAPVGTAGIVVLRRQRTCRLMLARCPSRP